MTDWNKVRQMAQGILNQNTLLTSASWRGKTIQGVRTTLRREVVNSDDGLAGRYVFSLRCSTAQFTDGVYPDPRTEKITIDYMDYRVLSVEADPIQATVLINLGDATA